MNSVNEMTNNEKELCEQMQKDGHCSSIDCELCKHFMRLMTTNKKLNQSKIQLD